MTESGDKDLLIESVEKALSKAKYLSEQTPANQTARYAKPALRSD